ncbi:hypothetical protein PV350_02305 [Streptomyces sp. PA03-6a]|nr:hypothetical protein [Streptomyces sp. PA03-6a]
MDRAEKTAISPMDTATQTVGRTRETAGTRPRDRVADLAESTADVDRATTVALTAFQGP